MRRKRNYFREENPKGREEKDRKGDRKGMNSSKRKTVKKKNQSAEITANLRWECFSTEKLSW